MGCLEAKCEGHMAALGKAYADHENLKLLDCEWASGMLVRVGRGTGSDRLLVPVCLPACWLGCHVVMQASSARA